MLKKIENDKIHIIEKCNYHAFTKSIIVVRSAINHELIMEDKVANLRDKAKEITNKQEKVK